MSRQVRHAQAKVPQVIENQVSPWQLAAPSRPGRPCRVNPFFQSSKTKPDANAELQVMAKPVFDPFAGC